MIRPVLAGRGAEGPTVDVSALPDGGYLQAYARRWIVQALVLFATLAFIAVIGTASTLYGRALYMDMRRNWLNML